MQLFFVSKVANNATFEKEKNSQCLRLFFKGQNGSDLQKKIWGIR